MKYSRHDYKHISRLCPATGAGSGGGGGYTASAVHFDGTQTLTRSSALTGVSASARGTVSLWVRAHNWQDANRDFWFLDNNIFNTTFYNGTLDGVTAGMIVNTGPAVGGGSYWQTDQSAMAIDTWYHVLFSVDTNHADGSKWFALYINGVLQNVIDSADGHPAYSIDWDNSGGFSVCASDQDDPSTIADFCDVQIFPGLRIVKVDNTIDPTNIANFISGGKPVDPAVAAAAYGAPAILFSGDATTFPTNQGTGGSFTLTGSLTNASSSPSD